MSSPTLYRKYRPQTFSEVIGQKHVVQTLTNALKNNRVGQAYLFTGPRGTGKTTLARLLAKAVNCTNRKGSEPCLTCANCKAFAEGKLMDIIEIDGASNNGVDNIRELRETVKFPPTQSPYKVYIIDEVHMLSIGAFNALLKTLEEPPQHVIFILATTALNKVPETIVSRCQRFDLARLPIDHITEKLSLIAAKEKVDISIPALEMIALSAEGGMRDAESLLMQVIALEDKQITPDEVASILGITDQQKVSQLVQYLSEKQLEQSLLLLKHIAENGSDFFIFANSLIHYLRQLLFLRINPQLGHDLSFEITREHLKELSEIATRMEVAEIVRLLELIQAARKEVRLASIPQLPIEIALVKFLSLPSSPTASSQTSSPQAASVVKETAATPYQTSSPPPSPAIQEESPETSFSIETIRNQWQQLIDATKNANSSLALTLANCQPLQTQGSEITLGTKFSLYKDKLNNPENRLTLEEAFGTILKTKIRVRVVVDEHAAPSTAPKVSAFENPLLTQAMNILGGEVVG